MPEKAILPQVSNDFMIKPPTAVGNHQSEMMGSYALNRNVYTAGQNSRPRMVQGAPSEFESGKNYKNLQVTNFQNTEISHHGFSP